MRGEAFEGLSRGMRGDMLASRGLPYMFLVFVTRFFCTFLQYNIYFIFLECHSLHSLVFYLIDFSNSEKLSSDIKSEKSA